MSASTPLLSNFLAPANPSFDLRTVAATPKKDPNQPLLSLRQVLVDQPPLGKNERIPHFLALSHGELAICMREREGYLHVAELNLWVPARHDLILQLIRKELKDPRFSDQHGAPVPINSAGCDGPLCRRQKREDRQIQARLRKERQGHEDENIRGPMPQYKAVDPIIVAFTIKNFHERPPKGQLSAEQKIYRVVTDLRKLRGYLRAKYAGTGLVEM